MRELIQTLVQLSLISAAVLFIAPEGGWKKYLALVISLAAVAALASSLKGGVDVDVPSFEMPGDAADGAFAQNAVIEGVRERLCISVIEAANAKYNIPYEDIEVGVEFDLTDRESIRVTAVLIQLDGLKYSVYVTSLKDLVSDMLDTECEVKILEE